MESPVLANCKASNLRLAKGENDSQALLCIVRISDSFTWILPQTSASASVDTHVHMHAPAGVQCLILEQGYLTSFHFSHFLIEGGNQEEEEEEKNKLQIICSSPNCYLGSANGNLEWLYWIGRSHSTVITRCVHRICPMWCWLFFLLVCMFCSFSCLCSCFA